MGTCVNKVISPPVNSLPPQQQTIYLHRESKGRGGKGVTLVKGLVLSEGDLSALTKKLKQHCGSGGTVKDGVIEIQGEQREKDCAILCGSWRYKVKGGLEWCDASFGQVVNE